MVNFTILAGGLTSFISAFTFTPGGPMTGGMGTLSLTTQSPAGRSPSWIQRSPYNSSVLYAVNDVMKGQILTFTIGAQGQVQRVDSRSTGGDPAYLLPLRNSKEVAVINSKEGTGMVVPLKDDLLNFVPNERLSLIDFTQPGRRIQSPPRQIMEVGKELFVADPGSDRVWRIIKGSDRIWKIWNWITQPVGSGPRSIAVLKEIIYILNEKSLVITSQKIPTNSAQTSPLISRVSTLPPNANPSNYAAGKILLTPINKDFPEQYLYASNRQVAGRPDALGDSIAIFRVTSDGQLVFVRHVFTGLQDLQDFIIEPSGKYLVAGGNKGGGVKVFQRFQFGANMEEVAKSTSIPSASSFVWV